MKFIYFLIIFGMLFSCKKEENTAAKVTTVDSLVYYNKWTKMNKEPFYFSGISDLALLDNKGIAIINKEGVFIIDSSFSIKSTSKLFYTFDKYLKINSLTNDPDRKDVFYYFTTAREKINTNSQLIMENNLILRSQFSTSILNRNVYINDTSTSNIYSYLGYGYDYFAYNIRDNNSFKYQVNYFNYSKSINKTIEFTNSNNFDYAFKLNDDVLFYQRYGGLITAVNVNSSQVTNITLPPIYSIIGVRKNWVYLFDLLGHRFLKTNSFQPFENYEVIYQDKLITGALDYLGGNYLACFKYIENNTKLEKQMVLLNLTDNTVQLIADIDNNETILTYWVNQNVLYILTQSSVYARKI